MKLVLLEFLLIFWTAAPAVSADPYQILGVSPGASEDEILKAYREKVKATHPDVSSLPAAQAQEAFKKVQAAWEQIRDFKGRRPIPAASPSDFEERQKRELSKAQQKAKAILEKDWSEGNFGPATFSKLPQLNLSRRPRGKLVPVAHGPKDEGEWNAIRQFLNEHTQEFLGQRPNLNQVDLILKELDQYAELTGKATKDIRSGATSLLEDYLLENAKERHFFLDTLKERLERLHRSGTFVLSSSPTEERKKALGKALTVFTERFQNTDNSSQSPSFQLSSELLNHFFSQISQSPARLHELNTVLRALAPALEPQERLLFLGQLLENMDQLPPSVKSNSGFQDIKKRAENQVARVFEKEPALKSLYVGKASLWNRLTSQSTPCEIMLGRLAKQK